MKIHENALKFIFDETLYKTSDIIAQIETTIPHHGGNKKNTLIILPENNSDLVISHEALSFLNKILNSIGLTEQDVIITKKIPDTTYNQYTQDFRPDKILFFGIKPFELGVTSLDINTYEVKHHEARLFLYADDLNTIQNDINKKKALWVNLKQLFS